MFEIKCKNCDATVKFEQGTGNCTCSFCGLQVSLPKFHPLLRRAFLSLEDSNWGEADRFCERVLDQEPESAWAYLGKMMVELHACNQSDLKDSSLPFSDNSNFRRILRFGDPALIKTLQEYNTYIRERNENARICGIYESATNTMNVAKDELAYKETAQVFNSISGYQDADELAQKCLVKAEEYRKTAADMRKKKKTRTTIAIIASILCICVALGIVFVKVIVPYNKYSKAVSLMNEGKYEEAISAFENMDGYKDSKEQIVACQNALKDIDYNVAIKLMNEGKFNESYESLIALNGYKDSAEKASECLVRSKIEKFKIADVGDIVLFGSYEQDNDTSNGVEEIEWIVLDKEDDKVLVISKYALDCQNYHSSYEDITWDGCDLRSWMNGTFLNTAFSDEEQKRIAITEVCSNMNVLYGTYSENTTRDKVFLLSAAELNKYFRSDKERKCIPTAYASEKGAGFIYSATCSWWLRTPGAILLFATSVDIDGSVSYRGFPVNASDSVRPALWINLESE